MFSAKCQRVACFTVVLLATAELRAQQTAPAQLPAAELVRQVVAHEMAANSADVKHLFRSRKQTPKGSQTRLYVETNDAMAGMLIAVNDHPLTPQQEQSETNHLAWLENNPEQLHKKHTREKEDVERTLRIVKALPDAFHYEYAGVEDSAEGLGKLGDQLQRLRFTPNPAYSPPSHVEQVLEGMEGELLIDPRACRIARIDGTLFREVSFGWGIIGHLDRGGHFRVQQADVGDGSWEITEMDLKITGRILLLKSLTMVSHETFNSFQRVSDNLPFARGVAMLKAEEEKLARAPEPVATQKTP